MPHKVTVEAKDVSLAIEKGLKKLGLRRDQVEVKILENPRKGFLGIGARPAVVELRQKRWVSDNLDAQIYMDVPKKKRSNSRGRGGRSSSRSRKNDDFGVREIKRGGRRAYGARHSADKAPKANEPQLLPSQEIQNAVIPEYLKAPLQEAKDYLANVLEHMGVKVENLHAWWDEKQHRILLTFDCDHPAIVIGKEGKTLESLQYLATLSISRHFDKPISVIADTQNYWRKAEDKINADLEYGINQIKNGYSVYRFRPMSAQLRRYIHRAAENNEFVITVSEGEGQWRKVTLRPRPADQPVQKTEPTAESVAAAPATQTEQTAQPACSCQTAENQAPAQTACACEQNAPCACQTAPAAENQPQTAPAANVQAPAAETANTQEAQPACACQSVTEPAPAQPACTCQTAENQAPVQTACACEQAAPCACQTAPAAENQPQTAPAANVQAPAAETANTQEAQPACACQSVTEQAPAQPACSCQTAENQAPAQEQPKDGACGPLFDAAQNEEHK